MFVITVNNIDASCHTKQADALVQKARLIAQGKVESTIQIVEKATFSPPKPQK
jgi:hypothetical protein